MPSPFPGMDPFLEERRVWPDVHHALISYIRETLQPKILPKYVARVGEHIRLASIGSTFIPDVMLLESPHIRPSISEGHSTATIIADDPLTYIGVSDEERTPYLEIIARESGDVVTVIEVIKLSSKIGDGRDHYLTKQKQLLATSANLVEVDLLGYGRNTSLARNQIITTPPDWRYSVSVSRADRRHILEVYACNLQQRLPRCRIPLRNPDPDVVLDLPSVFDRCYDVGGYHVLTDYSQTPDVNLSQAEQVWVDHFLREKGLRSAAV